MLFIRTWLTPRIAFWVMWTGWLECLQYLRLDGRAALLIILGPPVLLTWIGSRFARNPADTPAALFWKGSAVSCALTIFAALYLTEDPGVALGALVVALLFCFYMAARGSGVRRMSVSQGPLFERVQAIARQTGVPVRRLLVFTTPRDTPTAFAHRAGAILLSDRLLRVLSCPETDAVVAHEAAHLRPVQRAVIVALPFTAAAAVPLRVFWPGATDTAPFWPLAALLLWRALRRIQEFDADASAVRVTRDPEALITALTRVSHGNGLPLHWGWLPGLFIAHPPMTARFRSIARRAGISPARVDQLVSTASGVPPLPGYDSPFEQPQDTSPLSAHRDRMRKLMAALSRGVPILAGIGLSAVGLFLGDPGLGAWLALTAAWIAAAILLYWMLYEVTVGAERRRLRNQLPDARREGSFFVGLSTAAEPREFDGMYHYDLGMASVNGAFLDFTGVRCSFSLARRQVRRIWMAPGPPHWTPRRCVCIEYQSGSGTTAVISMQSLERWFWPGTSHAARELLRAVTQWLQDPAVDAAAAGLMPPQAVGTVFPRLRFAQVWRSLRWPCLISFGAGWLIGSASPSLLGNIAAPFSAPVVTAALILFALAPQLTARRS